MKQTRIPRPTLTQDGVRVRDHSGNAAGWFTWPSSPSFIQPTDPQTVGGPRLWVPPLGALTSQGLELTSGKAPRQGPGQASWSHLHPGRRPIINQLPSIPPAVPQTTDFSNLENNCTLTKGNWNLFRVQLPGPKCEVCAISSDSLSAPPQSGGPHPTVNSLPPRSGASKDLRPGWVTGGAAPPGHLGSRPPAVPPPPAHPPR